MTVGFREMMTRACPGKADAGVKTTLHTDCVHGSEGLVCQLRSNALPDKDHNHKDHVQKSADTRLTNLPLDTRIVG